MAPRTTMEVRFRTFDGVRIRYAESDGPSERTVLLTSPWPESVYAFAPIWSSLAEHARLFARRPAVIDAGEFVWEEAPEEYASAVLDSIS
jgi:hypothetical protein